MTFDGGAIAHVDFRVRCEHLGHGEEVFLVQEGDDKRQKVRFLFLGVKMKPVTQLLVDSCECNC